MKYFTLKEFIVSEQAKKLSIDNTPTALQKANVIEFVNNLLDPLREAWGIYCKNNNLGTAALKITSGIRSKALNEAIGGSTTSSHYIGYAADIVPYNGKLLEFKNFCINWLSDKNFDQFISEDERNGIPRWIHIGYKNNVGLFRKQYKYMINNKYYTIKREL
jgi:putative chitinase